MHRAGIAQRAHEERERQVDPPLRADRPRGIVPRQVGVVFIPCSRRTCSGSVGGRVDHRVLRQPGRGIEAIADDHDPDQEDQGQQVERVDAREPGCDESPGLAAMDAGVEPAAVDVAQTKPLGRRTDRPSGRRGGTPRSRRGSSTAGCTTST